VLCIGALALAAAFIALILTVVFGAMKSSDAYKHAMAEVKAHPEVRQAIGSPAKAGLLISGNINISGSSGRANLSIPVSGPEGDATVYVVAEKVAGQWTFNTLVVSVKATGERINLLVDANDPLVGVVSNEHGGAIYGTAIEYTGDIYLGRLSCGDTVHLEDTIVLWNKFDSPSIKVRALDGGEKGTICWIDLADTSFVDLYDPATKKLDPSRAELRGLDQGQIDQVLNGQRSGSGDSG
jgi:hypothetical protein